MEFSGSFNFTVSEKFLALLLGGEETSMVRIEQHTTGLSRDIPVSVPISASSPMHDDSESSSDLSVSSDSFFEEFNRGSENNPFKNASIPTEHSLEYPTEFSPTSSEEVPAPPFNKKSVDRLQKTIMSMLKGEVTDVSTLVSDFIDIANPGQQSSTPTELPEKSLEETVESSTENKRSSAVLVTPKGTVKGTMNVFHSILSEFPGLKHLVPTMETVSEALSEISKPLSSKSNGLSSEKNNDDIEDNDDNDEDDAKDTMDDLVSDFVHACTETE